MKLDKKASKKNNKARGLASLLLSMVMVGSGLSLTGCSHQNNNQNIKEETKALEIISTTEELTEINLIGKYWPEYEEKVNKLKEQLGLQECFIKDYDILNDIIKVLEEQETYNIPIEYIDHWYSIKYTSDGKICYDVDEKKLQLVLRNNNINVLKEYYSYDNEKFEKDSDCKIVNTKVVYDKEGNSLEFYMDHNSLTHNYDNMPIYTFEENRKIYKNSCVTNKKFTHFESSIDYNFYSSFDYTNFHYYNNPKSDFSYLTMYYKENENSKLETYDNNKIFNNAFNGYFDKQDINNLDKCLNNFYNSITKSTEYVLKK